MCTMKFFRFILLHIARFIILTLISSPFHIVFHPDPINIHNKLNTEYIRITFV